MLAHQNYPSGMGRAGRVHLMPILLLISISLTLTAWLGNAQADRVSPTGSGTAPAGSPQQPVQSTGPQVVTIPAPGPPTAAGHPEEITTPPLSVAIVTVRRRGFEPTALTRPAGNLLLDVNNRSGLSRITLRLDPEVGPRLREVSVPREKLDWREVFNLAPGRYTLTEANHPGWICRITVTPF